MVDRIRERTLVGRPWQTSYGSSVSAPTIRQGSLIGREKTVDAQWSKLWPIIVMRRLEQQGRLSAQKVAALRRLERTVDYGNAFSNDTASISGGANVSVRRQDYPRRYFVGDLFPIVPPSVPAFLTPTPVADLFSKGGELIRAVAPSRPQASLAVFLRELQQEGVPSLPLLQAWRRKSRQGLAKSASKEYLNVEFGWKPFLSDLFDGVDAVRRADAIWAQHVRNNAKPIRRSLVLDPVVTRVTTVESLNSYGYPVGSTTIYGSTGRVTKEVVTSTSYRFSGCFRYFVPDKRRALGFPRELARLRKVYGLDISPETLWNVTPWSWLSDWFVDFGGFLTGLSLVANDGLILQYGYLSEWKSETTTYKIDGLRAYDGTSMESRLVLQRGSKRRVRASPFGFGLQTSAFTARQWAILAALGINQYG